MQPRRNPNPQHAGGNLPGRNSEQPRRNPDESEAMKVFVTDKTHTHNTNPTLIIKMKHQMRQDRLMKRAESTRVLGRVCDNCGYHPQSMQEEQHLAKDCPNQCVMNVEHHKEYSFASANAQTSMSRGT